MGLISLVFFGLSRDVEDLLAGFGKIATDVELVPVEEVPFPGVFVDLGGEIDPLGYVASSKDIASEEELNDKGETFNHTLD